MKTKLLILFIGIAFVKSNTYGQIKDFEQYQKIINNAELNAIKGSKQEALDIYYNLLIKSEGNFSKDIYNALILANHLEKFDTFYTLLELVKKKNFDNEYLLGLSEFSNLHANRKWKKFINSNNKVIYIDTLLRQKIEDLAYRDQYFRNKEGSYQVYGDTIRKIDSLNMAFLLPLIAKNGLPGEKEIGARNFNGWQGYDIVIRHYCQVYSQSESQRSRSKSAAKKDLIVLTPILIEQIKKGRVLPNKFTDNIELQNDGFKSGNRDIGRYSYNNNYSDYFIPKYDKYDKVLIAQSRKSVYLEPLEDYYKKVIYVIKGNSLKLLFDVSLVTNGINNEERFNSLGNNGFLKQLK
jgi:hypothetical protein